MKRIKLVKRLKIAVSDSAEPVTLEAVYRAMKTIVAECKDVSARIYAAAVQKHQLKGYDLYVQIMYVQTNMGLWKGDKARETKAVLKQWMKENRKLSKARV